MSVLEIIGAVWIILLVWNIMSALRRSNEELKTQHSQIIEDKISQIIRQVYVDPVESDGQRFFLVYDAKTHAYLTQGKTQEEIKTNIHSRFPGTTFVIDDVNLKKINS